MRIRILVAGLLGVLVFAAPAAAAPPQGVSEQDRIYLNQAHQGNIFEIVTGNLAAGKGTCDRVRELGTRYGAHHLAMDADLIGVATRNAVPLNDVLDPEQFGQVGELVARSGPDFDTTWLRDQIEAHVRALALGDLEVRYGWSDDVKNLALQAEPVLRAHLGDAVAAVGECAQG